MTKSEAMREAWGQVRFILDSHICDDHLSVQTTEENRRMVSEAFNEIAQWAYHQSLGFGNFECAPKGFIGLEQR